MRTGLLMTCWAIGGSLFPSVALAAADLPAAAASNFERILASESPLRSEELWNRILRSDFELSSLPGRRHGYFEFYVYKPGKPGEEPQILRAILDDDGKHRVQVRPTLGNLPGMIARDDLALMIDESGEFSLSKLDLIVAVDEHHVSDFSAPTGIPRERRGFIKYSLGPYLSAFMPAAPPATWDDATRTLTAVKPNGTTTRLRFRTPNDQRRFGTILSELAVHTWDGGQLAQRCFIVDRASPLRLNIADLESIAKRLQAVDRRGEEKLPPKTSLLPKSKKTLLAAIALQKQIPSLPRKHPDEVYPQEFNARFQEMVNTLFWDESQPSIAPTIGAGRRFNDIDEFVEFMAQQLEYAYISIEMAITNGDMDPLVDDPTILWLALERGFNPNFGMRLYDKFSALIFSESVALPQQLKLCMAMGEFGKPVWIIPLPTPANSNAAFLQAVLHARWNWAPTEEEIALCQARLNDRASLPIEREAAIDSLIRWGRIDEIPQHHLDAWFTSQLAATPTHRHCTWKALTRHPDGRRFLRERLDSLASQPDIRRDIATMLCHRAHATLDMQRFDFMTADECRQTLDLCQPLVANVSK